MYVWVVFLCVCVNGGDDSVFVVSDIYSFDGCDECGWDAKPGGVLCCKGQETDSLCVFGDEPA